MLQGAGVVGAKVFYVQDCIIVRLENVHRLVERGGVGAGEDALSDPAAEDAFVAFADEVDQAAAGIAYGAMDDVAQVSEVVDADVFQHSY